MDLPNTKRIKRLLSNKPEWTCPKCETDYIDQIIEWSEDIVKEVSVLLKEYEELEFRMRGLEK